MLFTYYLAYSILKFDEKTWYNPFVSSFCKSICTKFSSFKCRKNYAQSAMDGRIAQQCGVEFK
jgi:hypothetical protein